jgi:hypothetical protein
MQFKTTNFQISLTRGIRPLAVAAVAAAQPRRKALYGIYAEVGAVEVVKGVVAPPTPSTETWWRAAVGEAVYTLRERELVQYVKETEVVNWTDPPC